MLSWKELSEEQKLFTILENNFLKGPTKELGANSNDTLMMPTLVPRVAELDVKSVLLNVCK
jgi:hypothetical protein